MDIKIIKRIDKDHIAEALFVWKLSNHKFQKDTIIISFMCIFFLVLGIIRTNRYGSFWNPWSSLGMAFAFIAVFLGIDMYNRKQKVISKAKKCIDISLKSDTSIELLFTDNLMSIRDSESYVEFKWAVFSEYQLYQNYLLVFAKSSGLSVIQIDKNKLSGDTWDTAVNFIANKLPVKK